MPSTPNPADGSTKAILRNSAYHYLDDMLGSVLPGLRDFRTPLAVGLLWLASVWLLWGDEFISASTVDGTIPERAISLAEAIPGGGWVTAGLFASYLLGAATMFVDPPRILDKAVNDPQSWLRAGDTDDDNQPFWMPLPESFRQPLTRAFRPVPAFLKRPIVWVLRKAEPRLSSPVDRAGRAFARWLRPPLSFFDGVGAEFSNLLRMKLTRATQNGSTVEDIVLSNSTSGYTRQWMGEYLGHGWEAMGLEEPEDAEDQRRETLLRVMTEAIHDDLPAVATRLQIEHPTLFDRWDRIRAESEFRLAVSIPLIALLACLIGITQLWWLTLALPLGVGLFLQGWKKRYESDSVLWQSLLMELVSTPDLGVLDAFNGRQPFPDHASTP
jgi:hypothetical protein